MVLRSVKPKTNTSSKLLGADASLQWRFDADCGTRVEIPEEPRRPINRPCEQAWMLNIESPLA